MEKIEPLEYNFVDYDNHYESIKGDTPFALAVRELIGGHWVKTGQRMPLEDAMFAVLAHEYNKLTHL